MPLLRFGGYQPERSVHTRAARALGAALKVRLGAALDFQLTPQIIATGRPATDLLAMTERGELDLCYFASSYLAERVPELGVLDLPFEGAERAAIWRRLDGEAGGRLKAALAAGTGYELLAFWDNGLRHISNGVRPIRHPRDCAGLSIRTLDNAFHQAVFAALSMRPRFLDVKDLAPAVHGRTIDAQENPLTNLVNFELHKTHRHVSLTGHFFGVALLLANRPALGRLGARERDALDAAVTEVTAIQRALAATEDEACLGVLAEADVEVVGPGAIDLAAFRAASADVVARATAHIDPALLAAWRG